MAVSKQSNAQHTSTRSSELDHRTLKLGLPTAKATVLPHDQNQSAPHAQQHGTALGPPGVHSCQGTGCPITLRTSSAELRGRQKPQDTGPTRKRGKWGGQAISGTAGGFEI